MSDEPTRMDKLLEGFEANKFTIEELEAIVDVMKVLAPHQTPIEASALAKLRWHISTAHNEGDE